jgi:hypothetical protein
LHKAGCRFAKQQFIGKATLCLGIENRGWQLQPNKLLDDGHQISKRSASVDRDSGI